MELAAFRRSLGEFAWRQWTALGVTGWTEEACQPVDPEALLVFAARLGDTDMRMRDAATDWCVAYGDSFVNETRLRSVVRELGTDDLAVSSFLATVAAAGGPSWSRGEAEARPTSVAARLTCPTSMAPAGSSCDCGRYTGSELGRR